MQPLIRLSLLFALGALTAGCPGPDGCEPSGNPSLEIGTGEREYEPLEADDPVLELVHGPQGGFHVVIGLDATGLDASELMLGEMSGTIDGEVLATSSPWLQMRCNPSTGTLQSWGSLLIWDAQPEDLHDKTALIEAEVTDTQLTTVSASIEARIHDALLE